MDGVAEGYPENSSSSDMSWWKFSWCGREDSNLHGIATASPSSWCVCQFRHCRTRVTHHILAASWEARKRDGARGKTRRWRPKGRRYKSRFLASLGMRNEGNDGMKFRGAFQQAPKVFSVAWWPAAAERAAKWPEPGRQAFAPLVVGMQVVARGARCWFAVRHLE